MAVSEQSAKGKQKSKKLIPFLLEKTYTEDEVAPISVIIPDNEAHTSVPPGWGPSPSKQVLHLPTNTAPSQHPASLHSILGASAASCSRHNLSNLHFLTQVTCTVRIRTISGTFTRASQLHKLWCCWERDLSTAKSSTEPPSPQISCFSRQKAS